MANTRILPPTPRAYQSKLLIKEIFNQSLKYEPDREIVYRDLLRLSYKEMNKRVPRLAHLLTTHLQIEQGQTVAFLDYDSHRYLEAYFAVPMVGAVLHMINFRLSPEEILYTINHAEDTVIFCHEDFLPILESLQGRMETVQRVVLLSDSGATPDTPLELSGEYEELLLQQPDTYNFPDFSEDTVATTFYTTGTTGLPKGVYFSHRQLVLHTFGLATSLGAMDNALKIGSNDVYMPITPMFHVHAWGFPYLATFLGMQQVYPGRYEPAMLLKLVLQEKVTVSHCVPTILQMLVNHPQVKTFDLTNWKVVIGGSALPRGLAMAAMDLGIEVITGYGMSETCPVLSLTYLNRKTMRHLTEEEEADLRVKTGRPIQMVDIRLMNEEGQFLPNDGKSTGEIVVRAPWLTQGYYKDEERSLELWKHGYLHTGDIATIAPDGVITITDRKKDVIKSGGEWISSLLLESLISQHPDVQETAVVAVPDQRWQERPLALVVARPGANLTDEELIRHMEQFSDSGRISHYAVPKQFKFVSEIPKTSVGKIDKKRIKKELEV
ncbi:fatty acid--CoA ligase [Pontibacter actiniarum]|uniref:Long-chain fatty acid--CoA ligase n=1 Tax=Pontibacter actiniarum TaxID=323450 RepID=A0A1X9YV88_9BACT|nr:fatty acid--CoA ligase [Pontibacter actiniarum]ARS36779.1 long-chain fatty acid--CoA ligase [Pontibacter actiniarum]